MEFDLLLDPLAAALRELVQGPDPVPLTEQEVAREDARIADAMAAYRTVHAREQGEALEISARLFLTI